jgi:hypothetical protein
VYIVKYQLLHSDTYVLINHIYDLATVYAFRKLHLTHIDIHTKLDMSPPHSLSTTGFREEYYTVLYSNSKNRPTLYKATECGEQTIALGVLISP